MANVLQGGFHPVSEATARYTRYEIASGYATGIFTGDVVTVVAAGVIEAASAGGAPLIAGIVRACSYVTGGNRIDSRYVPASTTYAPTARGSRNASYAWVYDDPNTEFWATMVNHAGTDTEAEVWAAVGGNMDIVATAGSTVYGQSGHTLDGNPIAGTAQFRIKEIMRIPGRVLAGTAATTENQYIRVKVTINEGFHAAFSAAGI